MAKISVKLPETIVNRLKHQELAQGGEKKYMYFYVARTGSPDSPLFASSILP